MEAIVAVVRVDEKTGSFPNTTHYPVGYRRYPASKAGKLARVPAIRAAVAGQSAE